MSADSLPDKKTKIVCTIGPASQSREVLKELILAGMTIARINFAHGDAETHRQVIEDIRVTAAETDRRVAIMGDLPGPKMRIGAIEPDPLYLERDQPFTLAVGDFVGNAERASLAFEGLPKAVKPGDQIFINDGFIKLVVQDVEGSEVHCRVLVGGELRSYKGVNFPGIDLGISAFTENDHEWLAFAAAQNLDAVSQSFVNSAADLAELRDAAAVLKYDPFVISKIERASALQHIDEILEATDGIMVARGDLGVEIPIERIAMVQKDLIARANYMAKPVITATHMMESMTYNSRPTRAEATDVANAILDGTDCVMLSGETAIGEFPVETVEVMAAIARETEPHCSGDKVASLLRAEQFGDETDADYLVSMSIYITIRDFETVAVVAPTLSGRTARMISRFRLPVWIIAVTPHEATCQRLLFSYGVHPVYQQYRPTNWEKFARDWLAAHDMYGELALLTQGSGTGATGYSNRIGFIDLTQPLSDVVAW
ncbi:MAG: pyruvate kinase [Candidatus Promineifilaceae bacterium]